MNVFKKQVSTSQLLLCASAVLNVFCAGAVYKAEKQSRFITRALERRGLITIQNSSQLDSSLPDFWARNGWTNTVKKLHASFDVAFFGNSITCQSDFQQYFPDKTIINLGYPGDNIPGMLNRISMLQAARPSKIFIMAGTNDLFSIDIDEFAVRYENLLHAVSDSIPSAVVYVQSILPMNRHLKANAPADEKIRAANNRLRQITAARHLQYIDVYSLYAEDGELSTDVTADGIHLLSQSYGKWAKLIEPYVNE